MIGWSWKWLKVLAESGVCLVAVVEENRVEVCYNICCLSKQVVHLGKCHCGFVYESCGVVL